MKGGWTSEHMIEYLHRNIDEVDQFLSSMPDAVVEDVLRTTSFAALDTAEGIFANKGAALRGAVAELEPLSDDELATRFHQCFRLHPLETTHRTLFETQRNIVAVKVNHGFWEHLAGLFGTEDAVRRYREMNLPLRRRHYFQADFLFAFQHAWSMLTADRSGAVVPMLSITSGVGPTRLKTGTTFKPVQRAAITGMVGYELARIDPAPDTAPSREPLAIHDSHAMSKGYEDGHVIDRVLRNSREGSAVLVVGPSWTGGCKVKNLPGSQYFLGISDKNVMPYWKQTTAKILIVLKHLAEVHKRITVLLQASAYSPIACAAIHDFASASGSIEVWDLGRLLDVAVGEDVTGTGSPLPSGNGSLIIPQFERCAAPAWIFQKIQ